VAAASAETEVDTDNLTVETEAAVEVVEHSNVRNASVLNAECLRKRLMRRTKSSQAEKM
jgi:hypothetical protein